MSMAEVASHGKPLLSAEREQLRLELQQLNHQISQQTQLRGLEVQTYRYFFLVSGILM
jgi:RING finger/CCCH-type zinc finger protein